MTSILNYEYSSGTGYEVYYCTDNNIIADVRTTQGGVDTSIPLIADGGDIGLGYCGCYAHLAEGDTFAVRQISYNENIYAKGVYTASEGAIVATSEHRITTTITALT